MESSLMGSELLGGTLKWGSAFDRTNGRAGGIRSAARLGAELQASTQRLMDVRGQAWMWVQQCSHVHELRHTHARQVLYACHRCKLAVVHEVLGWNSNDANSAGTALPVQGRPAVLRNEAITRFPQRSVQSVWQDRSFCAQLSAATVGYKLTR